MTIENISALGFEEDFSLRYNTSQALPRSWSKEGHKDETETDDIKAGNVRRPKSRKSFGIENSLGDQVRQNIT